MISDKKKLEILAAAFMDLNYALSSQPASIRDYGINYEIYCVAGEISTCVRKGIEWDETEFDPGDYDCDDSWKEVIKE